MMPFSTSGQKWEVTNFRKSIQWGWLLAKAHFFQSLLLFVYVCVFAPGMQVATNFPDSQREIIIAASQRVYKQENIQKTI